MRDIRQDLKERLAALDGRLSDLVREYNKTKEQLDKDYAEKEKLLDQERSAASTMLAIEIKRYTEEEIPSNIVGLADFIISATQSRPRISKDDLRKLALASGYFPEGETGGRAIHTTILNLVRANRLIEIGDNRYRLPSDIAISTIGDETGIEKSGVFE